MMNFISHNKNTYTHNHSLIGTENRTLIYQHKNVRSYRCIICVRVGIMEIRLLFRVLFRYILFENYNVHRSLYALV